MLNKLLFAISVTAFASTASAQVAEIRLGANFHDIDWTGAGSGSDKERSGAINGEIIFEEPEFLKWALTPQPYIGGAVNLGGETSYGGGGLMWRQTFAENFYIDFSLNSESIETRLAVLLNATSPLISVLNKGYLFKQPLK